MDMRFNTTKTWHKKYVPRVSIWKLKEEKMCEEYQSMVKHKVAEAEWKYLDVNDHWQQMKNIMLETAQITCGFLKGPCRCFVGAIRSFRWARLPQPPSNSTTVPRER